MAKGSDWEREISKRLSLWWTNGERDDVVWRTSGSGSRHTTRAKQGKQTANAAGDHCATHPCAEPLFKLLLIESKKGYSKKGSGPSEVIDPLYHIDKLGNFKTKPLLERWWAKAWDECITAGRKYPVIIFRRQNKEPCIVISPTFYKDILLFIQDRPFRDFCLSFFIDKYYTTESPQLLKKLFTITKLDSFLNWCKPADIRSILSHTPTSVKRMVIK